MYPTGLVSIKSGRAELFEGPLLGINSRFPRSFSLFFQELLEVLLLPLKS